MSEVKESASAFSFTNEWRSKLACDIPAPATKKDFEGSSEPIYVARNGDQASGEDPTRVYLYRSFHAAEAQLGISDYTPSGTAAGNYKDGIC